VSSAEQLVVARDRLLADDGLYSLKCLMIVNQRE
jgi:hypothetical protein